MSRIDDELKMAFRREPAPPSFTENVMERVRDENRRRPGRRPGLWRSLARWFDLSKLRLAPVAIAVLLILVIALVAYQATHQAPAPQRPPEAVAPVGAQPHDESPAPSPAPDEHDGAMAQDAPPLPNRMPASVRHRQAQPSSEAEAAKEQVMLALHIASSTLGDAQRLVREGE